RTRCRSRRGSRREGIDGTGSITLLSSTIEGFHSPIKANDGDVTIIDSIVYGFNGSNSDQQSITAVSWNAPQNGVATITRSIIATHRGKSKSTALAFTPRSGVTNTTVTITNSVLSIENPDVDNNGASGGAIARALDYWLPGDASVAHTIIFNRANDGAAGSKFGIQDTGGEIFLDGVVFAGRLSRILHQTSGNVHYTNICNNSINTASDCSGTEYSPAPSMIVNGGVNAGSNANGNAAMIFSSGYAPGNVNTWIREPHGPADINNDGVFDELDAGVDASSVGY
ncbi:MAG: hypothetical protein AAF658_03780, partial [Myxococcota bacterium]